MIIRLKVSLLIFTLFSFYACGYPDKCDPEELRKILNTKEAMYQNGVWKQTLEYTELKHFIITNLDTIAAHMDKKTFTTRHNEDGSIDTLQEKGHSYSLQSHGKGDMIEDQIPPSIYPEFKKLFDSCNSSTSCSIIFDRDSTVEISIAGTHHEKNIGINHILNWHSPKYFEQMTHINDIVFKDTIIAGGMHYTVSAHCDLGI